jgi:hypothetical protein
MIFFIPPAPAEPALSGDHFSFYPRNRSHSLAAGVASCVVREQNRIYHRADDFPLLAVEFYTASICNFS